jgi:hypothetical protein
MMNVAVPANGARLCACGSGMSRARCCELNLAGLGAPEANRHLVPLEERAVQARRAGVNDEAERLALDVPELAPGRTGALAVLYEIRKAQDHQDAAAALIRRIVTLEPNNFWATNEITLLLLGKGDVGEATRYARNAVRIALRNAQSHYLMGMAA